MKFWIRNHKGWSPTFETNIILREGDVLTFQRHISTTDGKSFGPGDTLTLKEKTFMPVGGNVCTLGNWVAKSKVDTTIWSNIDMAIVEGILNRTGEAPFEDSPDRIALVDVDGTLADFDGAMGRELQLLASPQELADNTWYDMSLDHIEARRTVIKKKPGFWRELEEIPEGFRVLEMLIAFDFDPHILTKGPKRTSPAWTEKVDWCQSKFDHGISITTKKGLSYGRILVDDWPDYIMPWLEVHPRGLIVMLDHEWNQDCRHPNIFRYRRGLKDTEAQAQDLRLAEVLWAARTRKPREPLVLRYNE